MTPDRYFELIALAARLRRADALAELEAGEALELESDSKASSSRWNGEAMRNGGRTTDRPTEAESEAFFAYEREHLGIDRRSGTCRKLDPGERKK